jgi:hypothetical protein
MGQAPRPASSSPERSSSLRDKVDVRPPTAALPTVEASLRLPTCGVDCGRTLGGSQRSTAPARWFRPILPRRCRNTSAPPLLSGHRQSKVRTGVPAFPNSGDRAAAERCRVSFDYALQPTPDRKLPLSTPSPYAIARQAARHRLSLRSTSWLQLEFVQAGVVFLLKQSELVRVCLYGW